jgi:argininosuccinate synthase
MAKIMVAMSGGVDSSLVAALLHEAGHAVTGVTMHLWDGDDARLAESLCCSQEMTESARRVCAQLGIPYYVFNYQQEFRRHVIEYFLQEYAQGYTPNPCLACNRDIKFRALLMRADALGFDYVATGHYARIRRNDERRVTKEEGVIDASPSSFVLRPWSFVGRRPNNRIGQRGAGHRQQRQPMDEQARQRDTCEEQPGSRAGAIERTQQRPYLQRHSQHQQTVDFGILRIPEREGGDGEQQRHNNRATG